MPLLLPVGYLASCPEFSLRERYDLDRAGTLLQVLAPEEIGNQFVGWVLLAVAANITVLGTIDFTADVFFRIGVVHWLTPRLPDGIGLPWTGASRPPSSKDGRPGPRVGLVD